MLNQSDFPALTNKIYFNYGGQGPLPQVAMEAIYKSYQDIQRLGPFSQSVNDWLIAATNKTREIIAAELGVAATTISLTEDVTVGCNIALWGIDWKSGDRILISDGEHPGVIAIVKEIQRRFGVEISIVKLMDTLNEEDPVAAIIQELDSQTKLIVISHVLWNTGQVLPLAKISAACKQFVPNVKILVDAAQSVGMLPLNLDELGIDFYAFTGHKWWCGPEGLGALYVRADALESLNPTFIGWRSINYTQPDKIWQPDGRRFEVATSAYPLYAGLQTAIAIHNQAGNSGQRYQQILELSKYLWECLNTISEVKCLLTSAPESGLISFTIENNNHANLVKFLESENVFVRTIGKPSCVRACVHYFTTKSEIEQLVSKIQQFCKV